MKHNSPLTGHQARLSRLRFTPATLGILWGGWLLALAAYLVLVPHVAAVHLLLGLYGLLLALLVLATWRMIRAPIPSPQEMTPPLAFRSLREFVEQSPVAVAIFDREMRYLAHSKRWITDYRLPPDAELVGRSHYDVFPDIPDRWREIHQRCLQGESLSAEEDDFLRENGTRDILRWEIQPWKQEDGSIGGVMMLTEMVISSELLQAEREQRLMAEIQNQIILSLISKDSQQSVLAEILNQVTRVISYDSGVLAQAEGESLNMLAWHGDTELISEEMLLQGISRLSVTNTPNLQKAISEHQPILITDAWNNPDWQYADAFNWIRSHVTYPIVFKEKLLGLLFLDSREPDHFSAIDVERLEPLIHTAAIVLQNTRLYEQSRQEIAQRRQAERALQRANEVLAQRISERTIKLETEVQERRRAETLLLESEERFRSAFTNAPIGLAIIELDGHFIQVNTAMCNILAQTEAELLNADYTRLPPDQDIPLSANALRELAASGGSVQHEKLHRRPDGKAVWLIISASYTYDEHGEPVNIIAQLQDVTPRKLAEQENTHLLEMLRHRNMQLHTAAAVSTTASSILDPRHLINTAVNLIQDQFRFYYVGIFLKDDTGTCAVLRAGTGEAGEQMVASGHRLPIDEESMIGSCVATSMPRISLNVTTAAGRYANPLLPETRSEMALPLTTPSSGCIGGLTVHSSAENAFSQEDIAALQSMAEQIAIALENARLYKAAREEITRRVKAEQALKQLNEDLERLVRERTAELAAANTELEAFAYSISHDLRAPVRRLKGFARATLEDYGDQLNEEGRDYLQRIKSASQHMNDLIDSMLALSLVTRTELNREEVDLSAMVASICENMMAVEPERQVSIEVAPGITANGDPRLLMNMLDNLIGNAWKFTAKCPEARIAFGTVTQNGETVYFVQDNGAGFDMTY
ncbi:MAG: PAS domain S-box protein, partial [Anaerolineae bacterium]|nr:PAS domain S-box protein [Anaerolineae bacterium]